MFEKSIALSTAKLSPATLLNRLNHLSSKNDEYSMVPTTTYEGWRIFSMLYNCKLNLWVSQTWRKNLGLETGNDMSPYFLGLTGNNTFESNHCCRSIWEACYSYHTSPQRSVVRLTCVKVSFPQKTTPQVSHPVVWPRKPTSTTWSS